MAATLEQLERRVAALEKAQNETTGSLRWLLGTVAGIKATQDMHTETLGQLQSGVEEIRSDLHEVRADVNEVRADLKAFRAEMPELIATSVGDALRSRRE